MPSHEVFWEMGLEAYAVYFLAAVVVGIAVYAVYKHTRLWKLGQGKEELGNWGARVKAFIIPGIAEGLGHTRILRDPYPGLMHLLIFWGCIIFLIGTCLDVLSHYGLHFMHGNFYLITSLFLDVFGILVIIGVIIAAYRRYIQKPDRLDNKPEDAIALLLLFFVVVTGFLVEGFRLAVPEEADAGWGIWSPGGFLLSNLFVGMDAGVKLAWHHGLWWFHSILALSAIAYVSLSFSKLSHILIAPLNYFLRPLGAKGALSPIDIETAETLGVSKIEEFSWKQLLDLDACTRCGRCQDNCPAYLSGKDLSPKKIIQDLKVHLLEKGANQSIKDEEMKVSRSMIGEVISEEVIWDCTTCRSCQEQCPVAIQHIFKIIEMRRHQALMLGKMPEATQLSMSNMQKRGHPWAGSQFLRLRGDWLNEVEVKILTPGEETDILLWVGCTGALVDRNVAVTIALVKMLTRAGVKFAVLGDEEGCCGDPARRVGYDLTFLTMAQQNIEIFRSHNIAKIVTACPHCFNAIKNEYPQLGGNFEVFHHTEFIANLAVKGELSLGKTEYQRLTYHDACYLGRYNDVYDAPRQILQAVNNGKFTEMDLSRYRSFCCGGGGGHMWLEDQKGRRINEMRVEDALAIKAETIATACPFCLQMLENGLERQGLKESIKVRDIIELVEQATR